MHMPHVTDAIERVNNTTLYTLSYLAGCLAPDTDDSPGADFLSSVRASVVESWGYVSDPTSEDEAADAIRGIADNAPSVYTHRRWEEFVDLGAYREDLSEFGFDVTADTDMFNLAGVALYLIAERLARVLWDELVEAYTLDVANDESDGGE